MSGDLSLIRTAVRKSDEDLRAALVGWRGDWEELVRFAALHHLAGWLYQRLERAGLCSLVPDGALSIARDLFVRQFGRNRLLARAQLSLAKRLREARVDALFMKGVFFALRFYGDPNARSIGDIDILLRNPADLDRVERLLLEEGFRRLYRTLFGRRVTQRFVHHFAYGKGPIFVEVHWVLRRQPSLRIDRERLWRDRASVERAGLTFDVLSVEDELLMQVLGVVTDLEVGYLSLKSHVDIYRLLATAGVAIDWNDFFAGRLRERTLRASVWVLSETLYWLDAREDFPMLAAAIDERLAQLRLLPSQAPGPPLGSALPKRHTVTALRLLDTPLIGALAWWILATPFRVAAYSTHKR